MAHYRVCQYSLVLCFQVLIECSSASRGLGLEIARPLLLSPSNIVFASCRDPENSNALQELRSEACGELHIIQLNVTDLTSIEASAKAVESILGAKGLDYLVNNAGIVSVVCYHIVNPLSRRSL